MESTEYYLKSIISEVAQIAIGENDITTPFQELGIDSFRILQIIRRLEEGFGTLSKTLLFENFNIEDLSRYFVENHQMILVERLGNYSGAEVTSQKESINSVDTVSDTVDMGESKDLGKSAVLISEKEAYEHSEFRELIKKLFDQYKNEGSSSRGTRNIAPNLFIGSDRRGYFNYSRAKNLILVYNYTGPKDYFDVIAAEMYQYCKANGLELSLFTGEQVQEISGQAFTATPFGVLSRINLNEFTLEGSKMRRLRYQVSKFENAGQSKTIEYSNGTDEQTDRKIADIIEQWCAPRTMVNPLIHIVKQEILEGRLNDEHRLFLTYLDDVLQNVILISKLASQTNGYLMDLEFYPEDMPLGGLESAIVKIIDTLVLEQCDVLSLGGTYGCKLDASSNADPELDRTLGFLREQNIFNDQGNLQFKNKFRPDHSTVFICRALGSNPDNVTDIIMMIADPEKMNSTIVSLHTFSISNQLGADDMVAGPNVQETTTSKTLDYHQEVIVQGMQRSEILSDFGYNPLNIPNDRVEFDLKTDSWAQLNLPAIENHLSSLFTQLQQPLNIEERLKDIFPFSYFGLTTSGRAAEQVFYKAWPSMGTIAQNILFPTTLFAQIENGFTPVEIPDPGVFKLDSTVLYRGDLEWEALEKLLEKDAKSIAMVVLELSNNAAGGAAVSIQHLERLKGLLSKFSIALVFDATRIVENAMFIIEDKKEYAVKNVWDVIKEICSYAHAVVVSLAKDFCVNKGGMIATNDPELYKRIQELIVAEGVGLDIIDKKIIALSMRHKAKIENRVQQRMASVKIIREALKINGVPVVASPGGHCVLIDVKQLAEFKYFEYPVASFLAWLYLNTGIRASAHNVGMQKGSSINNLVRLAIPVGLKPIDAEEISNRLIGAFKEITTIPELQAAENQQHVLGEIHSNFKLKKYHKPSAELIESTSASDAAHNGSSVEEGKSVSSTKAANGAKVDSLNGLGHAVNRQDIAIVGIAGRYPDAKNMSEFWDNLTQGKDSIELIPDQRYKRRSHNEFSKKYRGGFIEDIDKFDSLFFNISPREAEYLDPQERLFLEVAWETIEDAGYYPKTLVKEGESRNIGVFVGAVWTLYQMLGVEEKLKSRDLSPSSHLWGISNRVSYAFNLTGPSMTVDTACSSSLTALYLACESIYKGECSGAIVGGVNLDIHQSKFAINSVGGALSQDGVCRSFGKGANGYVAGEGVGAVYIKPLDQAEKQGDHIYGVIKGVAINHGGKTGGFMVPSPKAQAKLITSTLDKAKVDPRSIGYIEAHGTGTELGDPIEISGLTTVFEKHKVGKNQCSIGSVKTNIGHLEAAAGVVGLHKVLLQMKHKMLVPSLHAEQANPFIDFENSPFYVAQNLEQWNPKIINGIQYPLRAGISSFGAGGANAHLIVEAYDKQQKEEDSAGEDQIFTLSAKSEHQLKKGAIQLRAFLKKDLLSEKPLHIRDIAHTLRIGREPFDYRLAIVASSKQALIDQLSQYIEDQKVDTVFHGKVTGNQGITQFLSRKEKEELIKLLCASGDLSKLARIWVEGILVSWQGIEVLGGGKKVPLPTYPFADKRHWISSASPIKALEIDPMNKPALHPLIDSNESTFERQLFKKTFHNKDFFIYDHLVSDIPTLPGVAYLDLARKAGELAGGMKVQKIKNILWLSPLTVNDSGPTETFIELQPDGNQVHFEVFSFKENGEKQLHSQGKLSYANMGETDPEAEFIDLKGIQQRVEMAMDGKDAYPHFKALGLDLGTSFQVLQQVFQNEDEILGVLQIPESRQGDFEQFVLHPSLMDGTGQTGMAAQLSQKDNGGSKQMFVPYSFGEVEILHPLPQQCFAYVSKSKNSNSRLTKTTILLVDQSGKILVKIKDSVGVPLVSVHEKPQPHTAKDDYTTLYYSPVWEQSAAHIENKQDAPFSILFFDIDGKQSDLYRKRVNSSRDIISVRPAERYEKIDQHTYTINPQSPEDFMGIFDSLQDSGYVFEKICFGWPMQQSFTGEYRSATVYESLNKGVYAFLYLCKALMEQKHLDKIHLLYLYRSDIGQVQPHHDAINGFIKTLHLENSRFSCKTLEIQQEKASENTILDYVIQEFQKDDKAEMTVRYKNQERYFRTLKQYNFQEREAIPDTRELGLKEKGVYIIAGGAGGLGLLFAQFLAQEYKAKIVLTGRSDISAQKQAVFDSIRETGAQLLYIKADIAKAEDVADMVQQTKAEFGSIDGIIHSAGVLRDSYIGSKRSQDMEEVFAPKLNGTLNLDDQTRDEDLDFFVVFSSMAAVGGNIGQSDYAYANYFMDAFTESRELLREKGERKGKSMSFNWSIWADGGMKLDEQTEAFFRKTLGISPLSKEAGLEAFTKGIHSGVSQLAVVAGEQEKIELAWGLRKEKVNADKISKDSSESSGVVPLREDNELMQRVQNKLSEIVMEFLKLEAEDIEVDKILMDLGFDSIGLASFANTLNDTYKVDDITPVLFFEYPSIEEISKYLCLEHKQSVLDYHQLSAGSKEADAAATAVDTEKDKGNSEATVDFRKAWSPKALKEETLTGNGLSVENRFKDMPIAIVGMSGVMPQSDDLEEFWENLEKAENNMVTTIPRDRWKWEDYYGDPLEDANKTKAKWGGFMREIDKFDPMFWGISPVEASSMDPQQRIFLETVWHAIEDSGHKVSELSGTKTGVFVGAATRDYIDLMNQTGAELTGYSGSGTSHAVLANRISYLLNLNGPSAPIDTACSSSLVALHRAIESIHTGSSEMAIVGGVQVMLTPAAFISFGSSGMLAGDGKCKTFDERADGYVRGEGSGAIFIKPLSKAEQDGDHIYAVIKSTAENHGGKVSVLTAPNPNAQADLLVDAYEKAGVDPTTVGYIECHGTGTKLGDPIEVQAMKKAFTELYKKHHKNNPIKPHIGLTSVKSNIGHLETSAGIAGILKVLLSLKHKKIPALLHFEKRNSLIKIEDSPFYMVTKLTHWQAVENEDGTVYPRRAGVSSFGFGGANVHIVLEEYIADKPKPAIVPKGPFVVVLSAKKADRLKAYVQKMLNYIDKNKVELSDLSYTLQLGRDVMDQRLAMVVSTVEELKAGFESFLKDQETTGLLHFNVKSKTGNIEPLDDRTVQTDKLIEQRQLVELAKLWVRGIDVDWNLLYGQEKLNRLSLPTYPFARESYWFRTTAKPGSDLSAAVIHPFLHRNISTLGQQRYSTNFKGNEAFLMTVKGQKILPMGVYLEMLRVAVIHATATQDYSAVELFSISWNAPIIIEKDKELELRLFEDHTGQLTYEVFQTEVSCGQGKARLCETEPGLTLDMDQLKAQMILEPLNPDLIQEDKLIEAIHRGDSQLLLQFRPQEDDTGDYVLDPDLWKGIVVGANYLLTGQIQSPQMFISPEFLGALKIRSQSLKPRFAWIRYARGSAPGDRIIELDIDLLDQHGGVGLSFKSLRFINSDVSVESMTLDRDFESLMNSIYNSSSGHLKLQGPDEMDQEFKKLIDSVSKHNFN